MIAKSELKPMLCLVKPLVRHAVSMAALFLYVGQVAKLPLAAEKKAMGKIALALWSPSVPLAQRVSEKKRRCQR